MEELKLLVSAIQKIKELESSTVSCDRIAEFRHFVTEIQDVCVDALAHLDLLAKELNCSE